MHGRDRGERKKNTCYEWFFFKKNLCMSWMYVKDKRVRMKNASSMSFSFSCLYMHYHVWQKCMLWMYQRDKGKKKKKKDPCYEWAVIICDKNTCYKCKEWIEGKKERSMS